MGTNFQRLVSLANPASGFMQKIRVAEAAIAGYTFANGLVSAPPSLSKIKMTELPPLSVSGCGVDRDEALNLMMLEAVERNSSIFVGTEKLIEGRAKDISPEQWRRLLPFSNGQLTSRNAVPITDPYWVGPSLSNKSVIRFAAALSLADATPRLVPAALAYLGYGSRDEPIYAIANSNGCAAGETRNDAIFRGLLELIERDAFGIWWFNRVERIRLSFDQDEVLSELRSSLRKEGMSLHLVELTTDLQVPVVAALIANQNAGSIYIGSAAGTSELTAARKASLEALTFWFWGRMSTEAVSRRRWLSEATYENQPWLLPKDSRHVISEDVVSFGDVPSVTSFLVSAHCDPVVIDLTRAYFQIPVVRVMAPGLTSQLPRFAPGRLFDIPVKLGWLAAARTEDELLSYPCPL